MSDSETLLFDQVFEDVTRHYTKLDTNMYREVGPSPIIDQGANHIAGYCDIDVSKCFTSKEHPAIIFGDHTRRFKYIDFPFCIGADGTKVLKVKIEADPRYLYFYLNSLKIKSNGYSRHFKFLKRNNFKIPSLKSQKKIAAILDLAESIKCKRTTATKKLDELSKSIFVELFGDPILNDKKFRKQKLTEFFKFKTGKLDSNAAVPRGKYPFFTCSREDYLIDEYAFDEEALLLAGNNASADYSVKHYVGKFNAYQRTYVMNLADDVNTYEYAKVALEFMLKTLKFASKGSGTKYLTMTIFKNMEILVPPPDLQIEFKKSIDAIKKIRESIFQSDLNINILFESLQHQAFTTGFNA